MCETNAYTFGPVLPKNTRETRDAPDHCKPLDERLQGQEASVGALPVAVIHASLWVGKPRTAADQGKPEAYLFQSFEAGCLHVPVQAPVRKPRREAVERRVPLAPYEVEGADTGWSHFGCRVIGKDTGGRCYGLLCVFLHQSRGSYSSCIGFMPGTSFIHS